MRCSTASALRKFCSMNWAIPAAMRSRLRGMTAVCGMKRRPSGWWNSAVTANQSAIAPTMAASPATAT
jgi:hypothetical protein